jgi:hypothetical protein
VRLAFDRRIETQIYNSLPHHMQGLLRRHPLRCPVAFIGGTRSVEIKQVGLSATHKLAGPAMQWVDLTSAPLSQYPATDLCKSIAYERRALRLSVPWALAA